MPKNVHPAVEGLAEAFREGTARIAAVTPEGTLDDGQDAAKRCQHCGEVIRPDATHAWATVEIEGAVGDSNTHYPVFCNPTCLHEWSVDVDRSEPQERSLTGRR